MKFSTRFIFALLLSTLFCFHARADTYDLYKFEVGGIRLGMLPEEARQAAAKYFSVSIDEIIVKYDDGGYPIPGLERVENLPLQLNYKPIKGDRLHVQFMASEAHKDAGYMIVFLVEVGKEMSNTPERIERQKMLLNKTIQDYGPPTTQWLRGERLWSHSWCREETEKRNCGLNLIGLEISESHTELSDWNIAEKWLEKQR